MRVSVRVITIAVVVVLVAAGIFVYSARPGAMSTTVDMSVRPRSIYAGDTIKVVLAVRAAVDTSVEIPDLRDDMDDLTVRTASTSEKTHFGGKTVTHTVRMTAYEPGEYYVPGISVRYRLFGEERWRRKRTSPVTVRVRQLVHRDLLAEQTVTIGGAISGEKGARGEALSSMPSRGRVITGPIRFPVNDIREPRKARTLKDWAFMAFLAVLAGGAAVFLVAFIVSIVRVSLEKEPTPEDAVALRKLRMLRSDRLIENGQTGRFCSEVYAVMTEYVRRRFGLKKAEMTAAEFAAVIQGLQDLTDGQKAFLEERVLLWDAIKYAGHPAGEDELDPDLADENKFIEDTAREKEVKEGGS